MSDEAPEIARARLGMLALRGVYPYPLISLDVGPWKLCPEPRLWCRAWPLEAGCMAGGGACRLEVEREGEVSEEWAGEAATSLREPELESALTAWCTGPEVAFAFASAKCLICMVVFTRLTACKTANSLYKIDPSLQSLFLCWLYLPAGLFPNSAVLNNADAEAEERAA